MTPPKWELWLTNTGKSAVKAKVFTAEEGWAQAEAIKLSEELTAATVLLTRYESPEVLGMWYRGEILTERRTGE